MRIRSACEMVAIRIATALPQRIKTHGVARIGTLENDTDLNKFSAKSRLVNAN